MHAHAHIYCEFWSLSFSKNFGLFLLCKKETNTKLYYICLYICINISSIAYVYICVKKKVERGKRREKGPESFKAERRWEEEEEERR